MQQTPSSTSATRRRPLFNHSNSFHAVPLNAAHEVEVLTFLARRPIHTVSMVSLIQDNGLLSRYNRGTFFGFYNTKGKLEGVALVGHATLVETSSDRALECLAIAARTHTTGHLIMGESERIEELWSYYTQVGQRIRRACREVLFELRSPMEVYEDVPSLRPATLTDLDLVAPVHAQMAYEERGVDPLEQGANGFRQRCARRIRQGRTWISTEGGKLIFKADVASTSPSVIYLEGVWTDSEERSCGTGSKVMSQLVRLLLSRAQSLCVLVNENNERAQRFYERAGFERRSIYDTIFLL